MTADPPLARRDAIAVRLAAGQAVVAAALAAEFGVSEDAVRRDLRALAAEGRCRRVYGGALPVTPATATVAHRAEAGRERKCLLARTAAATVGPGELVFLDSGSTNLALVDALGEDPDLVVATNGIEIAAAVLRRGDLRLIVVGGEADPFVGGAVDAVAVAAVGLMRVDRAFVGACAVSARDGITVHHHGDAAFKRALLAAARHTTVLATADKLDARAPHRVAPLDRVDTLVLDPAVDPAARAELAALCPDVRVAG